MKKYLIILLPVLLFAFACDEDTISDKQSESFIKYYGGNIKDEGMRVVTLDDGGYLIMANMEIPNRNKDICIIKTDKYGNSFDTANFYGYFLNDYGHTIKKNDQGYIIAGSAEKPGKTIKTNILLVQLDKKGNYLWQDTISSTNNQVAYDLLVLNDQSLVMTGYTANENSIKNMIFVKTNSSGKLLQSIKEIGYPNSDEVGYSIAQTSDGNSFVLAGYNTGKTSNIDSKRIFIVKTLGVGTPIPLATNYDEVASAVALVPQENNNFIVLSNVESNDGTFIKATKILVSNDIKVVWNKTYEENNINLVNYAYAKDNKVYILGTSGTESFGSMLLLEINSDGSSPLYHYIGDGSSFSGNGFDFTSDNGVVITGANNINGTSLITLIKLKSNYSLK